MDKRRFRDRTCERAQAWASLELDDELSQVERALLSAHLRRCRSCVAAIAEMRAMTAAVRSAPLERPERPLFAPSRSEPARRRVGFRLAGAVAAAVVAGGLGAFAGSLGGAPESPPVPSQPDIALLPSADDLHGVRDLRPRTERPEPLRPAPDRVGGV